MWVFLGAALPILVMGVHACRGAYRRSWGPVSLFMGTGLLLMGSVELGALWAQEGPTTASGAVFVAGFLDGLSLVVTGHP